MVSKLLRVLVLVAGLITASLALAYAMNSLLPWDYVEPLFVIMYRLIYLWDFMYDIDYLLSNLLIYLFAVTAFYSFKILMYILHFVGLKND